MQGGAPWASHAMFHDTRDTTGPRTRDRVVSPCEHRLRARILDLRDLSVAQKHIAIGEITVGALGVGVDDVLGISEIFDDCCCPDIEIYEELETFGRMSAIVGTITIVVVEKMQS